MTSIPVIDLHAQYIALKTAIDTATQRVLASGWYILGKEVAAFEAEFAAYLTTDDGRRTTDNHLARAMPHELLPTTSNAQSPRSSVVGQPSSPVSCVGVNSGTDALQLALRACDVGRGDEVITVAHTAVATVAAIRLTGATPVLVDIDPVTYTMSPTALATAITARTKAIIPVHLYGHPAALKEIMAIAAQARVPVIEDCAQAHGARYQGQPVGTFGDLGCFSFYPTKNLGALGDGGAVVGRNPELIAKVRSLREYGWTSQARYISQTEGLNSRLDEMQAAILRAKLPYLDEWNERRRQLAAFYRSTLSPMVGLPVEQTHCHHVYHLYVVRLLDRDDVRQKLAAAGVGSAIHYPAAVHQQPAYQGDNIVCHPLPHTEQAVREILTLPLYPQLSREQAHQVVTVFNAALKP